MFKATAYTIPTPTPTSATTTTTTTSTSTSQNGKSASNPPDDDNNDTDDNHKDHGDFDFDSINLTDVAPYESSYTKKFEGRINHLTYKEVAFLGARSEFIASGSDDGHIFIWRKSDAKVIQYIRGDADVVNCIQPHPFDSVFASSGIEHHVKVWTPSAVPFTNLDNLDEQIKNNSRDAPQPFFTFRITPANAGNIFGDDGLPENGCFVS